MKLNLPDFRKLNGLVNIGRNFISTYRPEILLGTSITATIGGSIAAAIGGYKARGLVEEAERKLNGGAEYIKIETLPVKEKIQLTWVCYLPAAGLTAAALGSTTALHLVHVKDKKAMASAALAAADEVKRNMIAVTDEETDKMLTERSGEDGVAEVQHGDGEIEQLYLVRDLRTGRDIWSNKHRIEDALIEINMVLNNSGDVEVNHFYQHAGYNTLPDGNMYGWNAKDMVSLEWDETSRDDGQPVKTFAFRPKPQAGFDRGN